MGQPNPVAVLDKAVAILRAVADEPATLAELVARTGNDRIGVAEHAVGRDVELAKALARLVESRTRLLAFGPQHRGEQRHVDRALGGALLERRQQIGRIDRMVRHDEQMRPEGHACLPSRS